MVAYVSIGGILRLEEGAFCTLAAAAAMAKVAPRYLLHFSYIGTRFSGLQSQPSNVTVQGVLEHAIGIVLRLRDARVKLHTSSRTDAGVHALMNTASLTMPDVNPKELPVKAVLNPDPDYFMAAVNHLLWDLDLDVRVTGCRQVAHGFCPRRHAKKRTYLYRLAALKPEFDFDNAERLLQNPSAILPLIEHNRCWALNWNFDFNRFRDAAQEFIGEHNFASFMNAPVTSPSSTRKSESKPALDTMRFIKHISIEPGQPLLAPEHERMSVCFNFFDVEIVARSFLYRQIRRMLGLLVHIAQRRSSVDDLRWLLKNPHFGNWDPRIRVAPAGGLYLKRIEYDEKDFEHPNPDYSRRGADAIAEDDEPDEAAPDGVEDDADESEEKEYLKMRSQAAAAAAKQPQTRLLERLSTARAPTRTTEGAPLATGSAVAD